MVSSGKVVCLVSGGIDSPVAAWLVIRKGCVPIFIYYDNHPSPVKPLNNELWTP